LEKRAGQCTFAAFQHQLSSKKKVTAMSDHIENEGKKGKFLLWFFIYFFLFIILLIYLYQYNSKQVF